MSVAGRAAFDFMVDTEHNERNANRNAAEVDRLRKRLAHERVDPPLDAGWPRVNPKTGEMNT